MVNGLAMVEASKSKQVTRGSQNHHLFLVAWHLLLLVRHLLLLAWHLFLVAPLLLLGVHQEELTKTSSLRVAQKSCQSR